jgi:hypothetical protein
MEGNHRKMRGPTGAAGLVSGGGGRNPTLTIVALAIRQAEYIHRELGAGTI